MKNERREIIELKTQQYNHPQENAVGNLYSKGGLYASKVPDNYHALEKVKDVRMNVALKRIRKYKQVAIKSLWYQDLLMDLIQRKI